MTIPRPTGPGRAWMITLIAIMGGICLAIYLTRPGPKPAYNPNDLKQTAGAGSWADKEAAATPASMPAMTPASVPREAPHLVRITPTQPVIRQVPRDCPNCVARTHLLAAAQGSSLHMDIATSKTDEITPEVKPISTAPAHPHTVQFGTWLYAVLDTALDSDRPGDVLAHVSQPVYDTVTQSELLIPAGSHLHGYIEHAASNNPNNTSIAVIWDQLRLPDGAEVQLPKLPSADTDGLPGVSDKVDRHYAQVWGPALLMSGISAASMLSTTTTYGSASGYSPESQALGGFGSSLGGRAESNIAEQTGNIHPTLTVRKGTTIRILVNHDLLFEGPYVG